MGLFGKTVIKRPALRKLYAPLMHLSTINVKPEGGGGGGPQHKWGI